jgi:hypothetical protein
LTVFVDSREESGLKNLSEARITRRAGQGATTARLGLTLVPF